jgi:hypothetical protein
MHPLSDNTTTTGGEYNLRTFEIFGALFIFASDPSTRMHIDKEYSWVAQHPMITKRKRQCHKNVPLA